MLTVYVDFKSPASYLALGPTLALIERRSVNTVWRPFQTTERDIPQIRDAEDVGQTHRRVRAEAERKTHERYAVLQSLDLKFRSPPENTDLALGALALIDGSPAAFIRCAFESYWTGSDDLNTLDGLRDLLDRSGDQINELSEHKLRNALQISQLEAEDRGVVDAPAYLIKDQIFVGRQHMPWIEDLILKNEPTD